uniref:Uncharacterized protein n=1 Tax=Alexandrium andersonii TaxID=327968 RepID=A0A7S2C6M6_9DINO|mmetsp:Transcript_34095/g.77525  ORF Transcript_34095/g.77525 Transcript_34095/m.77525 type:complete len:220 (+) Transcript_34095:61-720(+)
MSAVDEGGVNEDMKPQVRRRPEEVFEVRQREQLKKSAGSLKKAILKIVSKAGGTQDNALAGLTKDVARPFSRLRSSVADSARASAAFLPQASASPAPTNHMCDLTSQVAEGSVADLERFADLLARLERTGGWPELGNELRQEVINFSIKHAAELESHARTLGKAPPAEEVLGSMDSVVCNPIQKPGSASGKPLQSGGIILPLLPPPPPPASGVGSGGLI